jgi:hypothetical protein
MCAEPLAADPELASRVEAMAPQLASASLDYMPRDPFWEDRYGERGRRFASEDAAFHLRYLRDALSSGSQSVLDAYGRWLRDVLVPRGMCTRHLQEHFEHLASACDRAIGDARPGEAMRRAAAALRYDGADAAAIQDAAPGIAERLGRDRDGHSGRDPLHLAHYVADAVARNDPATLRAHVTWARGAGGGDIDAKLEAIGVALAADPATAAGERMILRAREGGPSTA